MHYHDFIYLNVILLLLNCNSCKSYLLTTTTATTTTTNNNNDDDDNNKKKKECEKKDKYFDLARELKKLWNMQVTIIPIVIGAFGTVTQGLLKGLEDLEVGRRVETIQTTTLLRTARILRRVLETWGD